MGGISQDCGAILAWYGEGEGWWAGEHEGEVGVYLTQLELDHAIRQYLGQTWRSVVSNYLST